MADQVMKGTGDGSIHQSYADGMAQLHVANDMVRMDFFTQIPADQSTVQPVITGRLIMPIQSYLQMFELMRDVNTKLVANGVIEETK